MKWQISNIQQSIGNNANFGSDFKHVEISEQNSTSLAGFELKSDFV